MALAPHQTREIVRPVIAIFVSFVLFVGALPTPANETDQFNLPPVPLADIAPEVEAYVAQHIQTAIDKLNTEIANHEACVSSPHVSKGSMPSKDDAKTAECSSPEKERAKLAQLRSPDAVASAVHDELGAGNIFISNTGKWLNTHKFEHEPSRYVALYKESIYWSAPVDYATISPTIRVYGVEFGTDKFDHIFQQGYTYYRKYNAARKAGRTDAEALKAVVNYGRFTENTFFGYTVSGVYSNADLAANIAGLKFYLGLASRVNIYDEIVPPVVEVIDGHWKITHTGAISEYFPGKSDAPRLLFRFITDHLNEALNPSNYLFFLYPVVKSVVRKRACPEWRAAFPTATRQSLAERSAALTTWNGLDYGYKTTSRQPHLSDLCFPEAKGPTAE